MAGESRYRMLWTVAVERADGSVIDGGASSNYGAGSTPQEALDDLADKWDRLRREAGDALDELGSAREQFENDQIAAIFGEDSPTNIGTAA